MKVVADVLHEDVAGVPETEDKNVIVLIQKAVNRFNKLLLFGKPLASDVRLECCDSRVRNDNIILTCS